MKKIFSIILSVVLCLSLLTGCNLFEHNYERDYKQVIATIDPITESGVRSDGTEWSYTSEKKVIYKNQLVSYLNNYGMNSINAGLSVQAVVNNLMDQLIQTELVIIEADKCFESGEIAWTMDDIDEIKRNVYTAIDNDLFTITNQILTSRDEPARTTPQTTQDETTYPLFEDDYGEEEDEETPVYYEGEMGIYHDDWYLGTDWYIADASKYANRYPGFYGSLRQKSLGREAMKRLIAVYEDNADNLFGITDEEEKQIKAEIKEIDRIVDEEGVEYVYPTLGRTLLIKKLYGDNYIRQKKLDLLQDMLTDGVVATDSEVTAKYNSKRDAQVEAYDGDIADYYSAVDSGELILYNPDPNAYVFVKQILLPFSQDLQDELSAAKDEMTSDAYERLLKESVSSITVYPHVDGEDDLNNPKTVAQVFGEIKATMAPLAASPYEAERKFNEFIYKYNTDPGAFNNDKGYAVKMKLDEGEQEKWMQEFADGARELKNEGYSIGEMLEHYVVTSYGVHILYYAGNTENRFVNIKDYETPARYTSIEKLLRDEVIESKRANVFSKWQADRVYYYVNTAKKVDIKTKLINKFIKELQG